MCVKQSVDVDSVKVSRSSGEITTEGAAYKTNDFDKNALEEAIKIKERTGASVDAVNVGAPTGKDGLKEALALGADRALYVYDQSIQQWDSRGVALALSRL
ncbi:MAG: electron transfer flavoprotein subunit beta, partial [Thermoprotei archaeon]